MQIGERRIGEALDTSAKILTPTGPLCKQHLVEAAGRVPAVKNVKM
jgi:Fe-S oxidoreductase